MRNDKGQFEKGNSIGKKFSSNYQPDHSGRRKDIYTVIYQSGYSANDIRIAVQELAFCTEHQLIEMQNDKELPIITRILAKVFLSSFEAGEWKEVSSVIEQIIGKPKQDYQIQDLTSSKPTRIIIEGLNDE